MPLRSPLQDELPPSFESFRPALEDASGVEEARTGTLICLSSSYLTNKSARPLESGLSTVHACCLPQIPGYFSGVGDLFSALVLAHFDREPKPESASPLSPTSPGRSVSASAGPATAPVQTPLSRAASQALYKTQAILKLTRDHAMGLPEDERTLTDDEKDREDEDRTVRRMRGRELRIIQGQDIIRSEKSLEHGWMTLWEDFWEE